MISLCNHYGQLTAEPDGLFCLCGCQVRESCIELKELAVAASKQLDLFEEGVLRIPVAAPFRVLQEG